MQEMEYTVISCLGDENVTKALSDYTAQVPPWELHSVVPGGLKTEQTLQGKIAIMTFLVIMQRPHDPDRIEA